HALLVFVVRTSPGRPRRRQQHFHDFDARGARLRVEQRLADAVMADAPFRGGECREQRRDFDARIGAERIERERRVLAATPRQRDAFGHCRTTERQSVVPNGPVTKSTSTVCTCTVTPNPEFTAGSAKCP